MLSKAGNGSPWNKWLLQKLDVSTADSRVRLQHDEVMKSAQAIINAVKRNAAKIEIRRGANGCYYSMAHLVEF